MAAVAAAIASLDDVEHLMDSVRRIVDEREHLFNQLQRLDGLEPFPSQANFILMRVRDGRAKELKQALEQRGILIRYYNKPGLSDCVRISVGTPEQNARIVTALSEIL
jgi:histidinol-phosphate aminotransferase